MLHVIYLVACQLVPVLLETGTLAAAEVGVEICSPVGAPEASPSRVSTQHLCVISKDDLPLPLSLPPAPDLIPADSSRVTAARVRGL